MIAAAAEPSCIVCTPAAAAARQFLRGVLGDGVNDVELRAEWRGRGGLCRHHWRVWRWLDAPALSSSVLLRDLLPSVLAARTTARTGEPAAAGGAWWRQLRGGASTPPLAAVDCPACELESAAERRYLAAVARLAPERLAAALDAGTGFACLRHLDALPEGAPRALLEARLEVIVEDLETFLRRSDHRHAHEPMGAAGDAWLRAIRALGGDV